MCAKKCKPFERMTSVFKRISQLVRTDDNFFERIPQAVQTVTRSVRKRQTVTYVTLRITDRSTRVASDEMVLGWKLLKFIFEQMASVARTVDKFFFERIAQAVRTDNIFFKRISQWEKMI